MYYPSSENKGADQLRSYCKADLRLCFRLGRLLVFPCDGSFTERHLKQNDLHVAIPTLFANLVFLHMFVFLNMFSITSNCIFCTFRMLLYKFFIVGKSYNHSTSTWLLLLLLPSLGCTLEYIKIVIYGKMIFSSLKRNFKLL